MRPSGLKARLQISPRPPWSGEPSGRRPSRSQSRTAPLRLDGGERCPSGLKATVRTPSRKPRRIVSAPELRAASRAPTMLLAACGARARPVRLEPEEQRLVEVRARAARRPPTPGPARSPTSPRASRRSAARAPRCRARRRRPRARAARPPMRAKRRAPLGGHAPARNRGATRGSARRGRRGRARSATTRSRRPAVETVRRMRPLSRPRELLEHRPKPPPRAVLVHSARSEAGWAIFVFERVTRKRKTSAATACSRRRQPAERLEQVVLDDLLAPPSCSSRARVSSWEPASTVARQSSLHDELEEWRLDLVGAPAAPASVLADLLRESELARPSGRVDHGVDERVLDTYRSSPGARRRFHSSTGRSIASPRACSGQVVDPEVVARTGGDAPLEDDRASPRRPLGSRRGRVIAQIGLVDDGRELVGEGAVAVLVAVVEEVVLELVEDDEHHAHVRRPGARASRPDGFPRCQRAPTPVAELLRRRQPGLRPAARERIVPPVAEGADREPASARAALAPPRGSRRRRSWTTPACSSDVLPTPLGP